MAKPTNAELFESYLAREGMTGPLASLGRSIYGQESSSGANTATSNAGAVGPMQVIPSTFKAMADKNWDPKNTEHGIRAGLRYIKHLDGLSGGNHGLTAVGYYGGPGAMAKAREGEAVRDPRNPNAPDTLQYSDQVLGRMENNAGYPRVVRTPVATSYPIPAQSQGDGIPTDIPAYHGKPDQWSGFGRALPQAPVQPQDMNYGARGQRQSALEAQPVETQPVNPVNPMAMMSGQELMSRYGVSTIPANMQAFQGWGGLA